MQIKCTSCGATNQNIQGQNCNYCGNTLTDDKVIINRIQAINLNGNLFKLAEVAFEGSNYDEAINYYNKCLEIDADFFEAWYKKALSILKVSTLKNFKSEQVITSLNQAINNSPNSGNFKKRINKDVIPFIIDFHRLLLENTENPSNVLLEALNNINDIAEYIIDYSELNIEEINTIKLTIEKAKKKLFLNILVKSNSKNELENFDIAVIKIDKLLKKLNKPGNNETQESKTFVEKKNNINELSKVDNWARKYPKTFWPIALIFLFFFIKFINYIFVPNPTWCDCDEAIGNAIEYSVMRGEAGSTAEYDKKTVRACAEKVLELNKDLNVEPEELSIDYMAQFSYEICKYGYYEGKNSDNRGKKYYPKAD